MTKVLCYICLLMLLSSCGALHNIKNVGFKNTRTVIKSHNPIEPHLASSKILYLNLDSLDNYYETSVSRDITEEFKKKGYQVTDNYKIADYGIIATVRYFDKLNLNEWDSVLSLSDNILFDENVIAKTSGVRAREDYKSYSGTVNTKGLYSSVDFTGVISGSFLGFAIENTVSSILIGGIGGGLLFTGISKLSEPNNWLSVIDIVLFEKTDNPVNEYNYHEYPKGLDGKGKVEFTKQLYRHEIRTQVLSGVRGILMARKKAKYESIKEITKSILNFL